jgi:predicted RNase H-like HicB family nuclease
MQFNAIIEHDQDGFYAYIPSLHGCVSQGDTLEETLVNIKEALELYLEDMDEQEREKISKSNYIIAPIQVQIHPAHV